MKGERSTPPLHARQGKRMAEPGQAVHRRARSELVRERPVARDDAAGRQPQLCPDPARHGLGRRGALLRGERDPPPALLRSQGGLAPDQGL